MIVCVRRLQVGSGCYEALAVSLRDYFVIYYIDFGDRVCFTAETVNTQNDFVLAFAVKLV